MEEKRLSEITLVKLEKDGDSVTGEYVRTEEHIGENDSKLHFLKDAEGELFKLWGCASLDADLQFAKVGQKLRIVHKGFGEAKKKGHKPPKLIFVYNA